MVKDNISQVQPTETQDKYNLSWGEYFTLIDDLYYNIPKDRYLSISGIPRGGLIIAVFLSHRLNIPYVDLKNADKDTLVCDDICDSGKTLKKLNLKSDIAVLQLRHNSKYQPKYYVEVLKDDCWQIYPYEQH